MASDFLLKFSSFSSLNCLKTIYSESVIYVAETAELVVAELPPLPRGAKKLEKCSAEECESLFFYLPNVVYLHPIMASEIWLSTCLGGVSLLSLPF